MAENKGFSLKTFGMPWWLAGAIAVIVIAAAATGALSADLAGCFALMLAIGLICNEIGERIPFWNSYIGGGLVLTFLVSAFLFTYKLIPQKYADGMIMIMDDADFLSFFIIFLITGSILALDRKLLIRSFAGYIPAIFGGLLGAGILGIAAGLLFGISPVDILLKYVCPIMGGAFFLAIGFYALGRLFAKALLPTIFGVAIHQFAYMIIFVALVAALGIVPENIRAAAKKLQSFFTANLILIIMVGVGVDTNIIELAKAITPGNVVIALAIVIGAIIGSALVGYLVGFFPIDSAITAGLCMANRGGSGDLAVLGACDRMGLIAYAQLSSRLGGGIVLIIASILFGAFLK